MTKKIDVSLWIPSTFLLLNPFYLKSPTQVWWSHVLKSQSLLDAYNVTRISSCGPAVDRNVKELGMLKSAPTPNICRRCNLVFKAHALIIRTMNIFVQADAKILTSHPQSWSLMATPGRGLSSGVILLIRKIFEKFLLPFCLWRQIYFQITKTHCQIQWGRNVRFCFPDAATVPKRYAWIKRKQKSMKFYSGFKNKTSSLILLLCLLTKILNARIK